MKYLILICLILTVSATMLLSKSLKIGNSIIYKVPEGWNYIDSTKSEMVDLGILTSAVLENPAEKKKFTISVLKVSESAPGVQHSTQLIEATLAPWIEAYRKKGSHYYPRKILGRENLVYYSQEVGRLDAKKIELRGILLKKGNDWVNFFCIGPNEISWKEYSALINGTKLLNN